MVGDVACLARFTQELARPQVAVPTGKISVGGQNSVDLYQITARAAQIDLGFRRPGGQVVKTGIWGYDGQFPGPTIEARSNVPIVVRWVNALHQPDGSALKLPFVDTGADGVGIDRSVPGAACTVAGQTPCTNPYRMVVHFHGGHSAATSDGYAACAYDPVGGRGGMTMPGEPCLDTASGSRQFTYGNRRQGTSLWYHDHGMGTTRYGVMAGLVGLYYTRDSVEANLAAARQLPPNDDAHPARDREIPLLIMDRSFDEDPASPTYGQMRYATNEHFNTDGGVMAQSLPAHSAFPSDAKQPEFFGKTVLVNGTIWPKLTVQPQKYRFRILNGSNARVYALRLEDAANPSAPVPRLLVIGSDGGLNRDFLSRQLADPALSPTRLILAPGERYDVIVDFTGFGNRRYVLRNDAPAPFKGSLLPEIGGNVGPDRQTTGSVMRFDVRPSTAAGGSDLSLLPDPASLRALPGQANYAAQVGFTRGVTERWLTLHETDSGLKLGDDGVPHGFMDAPTERVRLGTTEIWHIVNFTPDTHPIHMHFVPFRVMTRQTFDAAAIPDSIQPGIHRSALGHVTSLPRPAADYEGGLKDVVRANPGEITTIVVHFCGAYKQDGFTCAAYDPVADASFLGLYVWHCHILEHEDNEMMRPLEVLAPKL